MHSEDLVWQLSSFESKEANNKDNAFDTENLEDVLKIHNKIYTLIYYYMHSLLTLQVNSLIFYKRITANKEMSKKERKQLLNQV